MINMNDYKYFLIVDLEATCNNDGSIPRIEMETIEIGAVLINEDDLEIVDTYTTFIRPTIHPYLSNFCTKLTTIHQEDVVYAPKFSSALVDFENWINPYTETGDILFCSWGDYDKNQLKQDAWFHSVSLPYPFNAEHYNIKTNFSISQKRKKLYGLAKALRIINEVVDGTLHRGIDDARNMVKLMPYVLGRKTLD
jgi:inhibitor of KinA sporulation pathway (predicted exonuclease)